jgi:coenzyme F420-reducing hydrogenase alpha subunit
LSALGRADPGVSGRGGGELELFEVSVLQAPRLSAGDVTGGADAELDACRVLNGTSASGGGFATSSFTYHHARLVEIVACLEAIGPLAGDPELQSPQGTLFHHYQVDDDGLITRVNLIIATGQNNLAMNRTVAQIARHYIGAAPLAEGAEIPEALLNRVEAGIRCFDPCLSCSTHAAGQIPLRIALLMRAGGCWRRGCGIEGLCRFPRPHRPRSAWLRQCSWPRVDGFSFSILPTIDGRVSCILLGEA